MSCPRRCVCVCVGGGGGGEDGHTQAYDIKALPMQGISQIIDTGYPQGSVVLTFSAKEVDNGGFRIFKEHLTLHPANHL